MATLLLPTESVLLALKNAFEKEQIKIELETNEHTKEKLTLYVKINDQIVQTSEVKLK